MPLFVLSYSFILQQYLLCSTSQQHFAQFSTASGHPTAKHAIHTGPTSVQAAAQAPQSTRSPPHLKQSHVLPSTLFCTCGSLTSPARAFISIESLVLSSSPLPLVHTAAGAVATAMTSSIATNMFSTFFIFFLFHLLNFFIVFSPLVDSHHVSSFKKA